MRKPAMIGLVALTSILAHALAQEKREGADGVKCIIMTNKPIKKEVSSKLEGRDVYFCCKMCKAKFDKDPAKYAEAAKAQWAAMTPLAVQVKCPGTGKPVSMKQSVEGDHGPIYFCCGECKAAWQKDSAAMKAKLADCFTYQTLCPVMNEPIDPKLTIEHEGQTIYLCCDDCIGEFKKDAAKHAANAAEQVKKNKAASEKAHGKP